MVRSLEKSNEALSKRRRAKRTRVQDGGVLSVQAGQELLAQKATNTRRGGEQGELGGQEKGGAATQRRCGNCGKPGHNTRTCQKDVELSRESNSQ